MNYIAIHGRQPELGVAELEALYGPANINPINSHASFVKKNVDFKRLGSIVKFASYLETHKFINLNHTIESALPLIINTRKHRQGKIKIGVSVYGRRISPNKINRYALNLKKQLRSKGFSVRLVPNRHPELNAAQVLNNKLTKDNGFELLVIFDRDKVHLARTLNVQDIDEYTRRDRQKPIRNTLVGMLPPKLAQTLINLANPDEGARILDPFCGTGTVLIESFAMGYDSYGSDLAPNMVEASKINLKWFSQSKTKPKFSIERADACSYEWEKPIDTVVAETYLGPALRSLPDSATLKQIVVEVDDIHRRFLLNLAPQLKPGSRVTLAIPAWHKNGDFIKLPILDDLEKLGYNPSSFIHIKRDLVYHRPNQLVGRYILVMQRK